MALAAQLVLERAQHALALEDAVEAVDIKAFFGGYQRL